MRRRTKVVALILTLVVLVLGLTLGGIALAQEPTPTPTPKAGVALKDLWGKVATILGIDKQTLTNAVGQAQRELIDEAIAQRLAKAVEKGIITQQQADQIKQWLSQRPDILSQGLGRFRFGRILGDLSALIHSNGVPTKDLIARVAKTLNIEEQKLTDAIKQAQQEIRNEALSKWLDKLVEKGILTQEQANQIRAWWSQRPNSLPQGLFPWGLGHFSGPMSGMMHKGMGGKWYKGNEGSQTQSLPQPSRGMMPGWGVGGGMY